MVVCVYKFFRCFLCCVQQIEKLWKSQFHAPFITPLPRTWHGNSDISPCAPLSKLLRELICINTFYWHNIIPHFFLSSLFHTIQNNNGSFSCIVQVWWAAAISCYIVLFILSRKDLEHHNKVCDTTAVAYCPKSKYQPT